MIAFLLLEIVETTILVSTFNNTVQLIWCDKIAYSIHLRNSNSLEDSDIGGLKEFCVGNFNDNYQKWHSNNSKNISICFKFNFACY